LGDNSPFLRRKAAAHQQADEDPLLTATIANRKKTGVLPLAATPVFLSVMGGDLITAPVMSVLN